MNCTPEPPFDYINSIRWRDFDTAYGDAEDVPKLLIDLYSPIPAKWRKAANSLWAGLCHDHAYVSSAACPATPVLLGCLKSFDEEHCVEILDILVGISCGRDSNGSYPEWLHRTKNILFQDRSTFLHLSEHPNEDIADFSGRVLTCLDAYMSAADKLEQPNSRYSCRSCEIMVPTLRKSDGVWICPDCKSVFRAG